MDCTNGESSVTAVTKLLQVGDRAYAYRRLGGGSEYPLLCLQHFTGTLDNWDPAVTDALASDREIILFDNAGVGRSSGDVPTTIGEMTQHALAFLDALGIDECDVLGFSLGGMVAQQMALDRPSIVRRMVLVATAPRGGQDVMHIEKEPLASYFADASLKGYARLQKLFFAPTASSQKAGAAFISRLEQRRDDRDLASGDAVAREQIAAFREWEIFSGERFASLRNILQPVLVVHGIGDEMIPVRNAYSLAENLANAMLLTYPNSGHGALFQYHESFNRQAMAFLDAENPFFFEVTR